MAAQGKNTVWTLAVVFGLIAVTVLSLGFVAYTSLNPQTTTVTQQQFLTETQSQVLTQTVTTVSTATSVSSVMVPYAAIYAAPQYVGSSSCGIYGCSLPSLGAYVSLCQSTGQNGMVQCSGYLSQPANGCTAIAIPYMNPYLLESVAYQYYTLRNVTTTLPAAGGWVTVTGVLGQGYTPGLNGAACPGNYINVNSVSP